MEPKPRQYVHPLLSTCLPKQEPSLLTSQFTSVWGNISWGHAVSRDLVTWTDIHDWRDASSQALVGNLDGAPYDKLGIFSGTAQPVSLKGEQDGTLTVFYTGVSVLPTNWRIPYTPGTEKQSIATSKDGGKTWQRYEGNPVLASPPEGWNVSLDNPQNCIFLFLLNQLKFRLPVGETLSLNLILNLIPFSTTPSHISTW